VNIPAFPNGVFQNGMTLRDFFAAQALNSIIPIFADEDSCVEFSHIPYLTIATEAYDIADAMMEVRKQP
jgi:hypothetical protein